MIFSMLSMVQAASLPADAGNSIEGKNMKKILVVETNVDHYGDTVKKTGVWLEEITSFYAVLTQAGYTVDFASAQGGVVPVDPASANADVETMTIFRDAAFHRAALEETLRYSEINPAEYAAIYYGGGHGAMWDFPDNADLQRIAEAIYADGGYVTSVCHGEAGLLNLRDAQGAYLIKDRKINGFTDQEEQMNGTAGAVPFLAETELTRRGAAFVQGAPFTEFAVQDGRFITGQNPMSSHKVAVMLAAALKG